MLNLVIFGGPGSGKGTQSAKIADKYGLYHISTGQVLRDHIARGTELGQLADKYISKGQLIPDSLMLKVLGNLLHEKKDQIAKGVIFDGFPRTIEQARQLDTLLASHNTGIHKVVGLEVPDNVLVDRMLRRGEETGRADDNIDTIQKRLKVYHDQTSPLRDFYHDSGRYARIDGDNPIDHIFNQISNIIEQPKTDKADA